jgi:hypothetical protein
MASFYDASLVDWYVVLDYDGDQVGDDLVRSISFLDDPRQIGVGLLGMPLDGLAGTISVRRGAWYGPSNPIGCIFRSPLAPGRQVIATLTLQIAGTPGTYSIAVTNAFSNNPLATTPLDIPPGAGLTVTVAP